MQTNPGQPAVYNDSSFFGMNLADDGSGGSEAEDLPGDDGEIEGLGDADLGDDDADLGGDDDTSAELGDDDNGDDGSLDVLDDAGDDDGGDPDDVDSD